MLAEGKMDFPTLRRYIIDQRKQDIEHAILYRRRGACLCGGPKYHRANSTRDLEEMIQSGVLHRR